MDANSNVILDLALKAVLNESTNFAPLKSTMITPVISVGQSPPPPPPQGVMFIFEVQTYTKMFRTQTVVCFA